MGWQVLLVISMVAEITGRLLHRAIMKEKDSDPIAYAVLFQLITALFIGSITVFTGFHIPDIMPILPNLLLMPILYAIANIMIFKALKSTEASIYTILFASHTIWIILGAVFFLHEAFFLKQIVGALLILFSIILVSWKHQNIKFGRGEMMGLIAAAVYGLAITNDVYIIKSFDLFSYLTIAFFAPAIVIWLLYPASTKNIIAISKSYRLKKIFLLAFVFSIVTLSYFYAYTLGKNIGQIATIFEMTTVLTVIAAIFFLKEKSHLLLKIIAGVISFLGVLLVAR